MKLPPLLGERRTGLMVRLVLNGLLQAGATIGSALLIKLTFDSFIGPSPATADYSLTAIGAAFVVLALVSAGARMFERINAEKLGQDYVHRLRLVLYSHLSYLAPRQLQQRSQGSIMLRFIGDLTALRQWVSLGLARLLVAGIAITVALLALAFISWQLALAVAAVLVPGTVLSLFLGKPLLQAVREARRRRSFLVGNLNEKVASMAVVQVSGQTRREQSRIERQSGRLKTAMILRAWVIGGLRAVTTATSTIATAATLMVGAVLVTDGQVTPGTLVAAMSVVAFLMPSLRDLGRVYEYWQGARVSVEKLHQFLDNPVQTPKSRRTSRLKHGAGELVFRRVSVSGSLNNFSATAASGSLVAIAGPNGAGKSTVLSLVARMVDPDGGRVRLDGKDLGKLARDSLRQVAGMVSTDLPLLLDEADTNLDPAASAIFNEILADYEGTVLMATHHLDRALCADVLWYMENGKLLATGKPDELLKSDRRVAEFFRQPEQQALAS